MNISNFVNGLISRGFSPSAEMVHTGLVVALVVWGILWVVAIVAIVISSTKWEPV